MKKVVVFAVVMGMCTVACAAVWDRCATDRLYHCTDSISLVGYLEGPGSWVHGAAAGEPGEYGDWIKPGWTMGRLEMLWGGMWGASVVVSGGAAVGVGRLWRR